MPFLTRGTVFDAVRSCALLLLVNGIYLLRARAEEAHLGDDPAYQAYAAWIAEHGLIARLRRLTAGRVATAT